VTAAYYVSARLEISKAVSVTERLGWPPVMGEMGRGKAARPKSRVERRIQKFIEGASTGEPSLVVFGGVVLQGEAKAGKSWRRGGAMGAYQGIRGTALLCRSGERTCVERSPGGGGPDAESESNETEHRNRSTGRGSATAGLSLEGQAGIGRGLSAAVSRSGASDEGEA
jgi:hypothetical protein